ncbi:hypothetical protein HNP84_006975 [Thermocatellispora tengchongensis]|uniref:Uncharacterized protein n=1 Tax=Thermocatellispora tengchongensis TaxID=1073253 RepID=A0A840PH19_9ACTN|nr:hypothetical protein [Thermocatellispora tengchongensis]
MPLAGELGGEFADGGGRPSQRGHRIAARVRLDQSRQCRP